MAAKKSKNILFINIAFIIISAGILIFLLNAPEETTAKLPHDDDHSRFIQMGKKEAEKFCTECHAPEAEYPLPEGHPPKYRCLFCHKRE
ncbi:MAG: hypothetical protein ABFR63_02530 [Thermodesulfobacteriota bacterium]